MGYSSACLHVRVLDCIVCNLIEKTSSAGIIIIIQKSKWSNMVAIEFFFFFVFERAIEIF